MKTRYIVLWTLSAFLWTLAAHAQGTVDVAKITCNQFAFGRITDSRTLSIWVAGYYNGTIKNTVVDVAKAQERANELVSYCVSHPDIMLMDAAKSVIGAIK